MAGVEHDDHRPRIATDDAQHLVEIRHAQAVGEQGVGGGRIGEEVIAAAGQVADAVAGDEQDGDVVRPGLSEKTRQARQDALARHLLVGQYQRAHLAVGAALCRLAQGLGNAARVGVGELQPQVGGAVAADADRQHPQHRAVADHDRGGGDRRLRARESGALDRPRAPRPPRRDQPHRQAGPGNHVSPPCRHCASPHQYAGPRGRAIHSAPPQQGCVRTSICCIVGGMLEGVATENPRILGNLTVSRRFLKCNLTERRSPGMRRAFALEGAQEDTREPAAAKRRLPASHRPEEHENAMRCAGRRLHGRTGWIG